MRIHSFSWSNSGCGWIRINTPFKELSKKHYIRIADGKTPYKISNWDIVIFSNLMGNVVKIEKGEGRPAMILLGFKDITPTRKE